MAPHWSQPRPPRLVRNLLKRGARTRTARLVPRTLRGPKGDLRALESRYNGGTRMDHPQRPMRPLSLGRPVHSGRREEPLSGMPERVPEHGVAPDGIGKAESVSIPDTSPERLYVALVVKLDHYERFSKWLEGHVRVVKPSGWGGEVVLCVLPDLGEDLVDFDQYGPPPTITLREGVPK